jgi:quinolinate synthase
MKQVMPELYRGLTDEQLQARIHKVKSGLGSRLVILTHHYQCQEVVDLGDYGGDSFGLSKKAAEQQTAEFIVFCGVHFMAESAAVLGRPEQAVFIPDLAAGCPMAEMAPIETVLRAEAEIERAIGPGAIVPVTYVNSSAAVKSFCGANGGACCTSSNADRVFDWAFRQRPKVLFLPDEHLGRNTAAKLGAGPAVLYDPQKPGGGLDPDQLRSARVILWKGFCHVHTAFTVEQIAEKRRQLPGCLVVVHPECRREVVAAADASGSTEGIVKFVEAAPPGAVIVVGTEVHLVERLQRRFAGAKTVVPLARSLCPNMYRINLHNLCWVLEAIATGPERWVNRVTVPAETRSGARLALTRMLEIVG